MGAAGVLHSHFFPTALTQDMDSLVDSTCAIIKESMPKTTQAALSLSMTVVAEAAGKFDV